MSVKVFSYLVVILPAVFVMWGCGTPWVSVPPKTMHAAPPPADPQDKPIQLDDSTSRLDADPDMSWSIRTVTDEELWTASERDPELSPVACREILARLNIRAHYHISEDIANARPLKVPNDFSSFKKWTPLPVRLSGMDRIPKSIVVVKEIPYLGWYEEGRLLGDSMACIGNREEPTDTGQFKIEEKDADHISRSYTNLLGLPAWMRWAMRLYGTVWIHAGDITGPHCSHGCVTLPLKKAETLFRWADLGTPVFIVDSLEDLEKAVGGAWKPPPGTSQNTTTRPRQARAKPKP